MTNITQVEIDQRISFEVYPAERLGNNFKNVRMCAVLNPETARALGHSLYEAHQNVYPTIPTGQIPNNPTQYNYVQVQFENGEKQIIGIPWIRPDSVVINDGKTLTLVFQDLDQRRKDRILAAVAANNERPSSIVFE
jgi:hypothetical protein